MLENYEDSDNVYVKYLEMMCSIIWHHTNKIELSDTADGANAMY